MSDPRPLPTVIGPTENALRALLTETLSGTRIPDYPSWVTLNFASGAAVAGSVAGDWRAAVADGLKQPVGVVDEVVARLSAAGLMNDDGSLTDLGASELDTARAAGRAVTAELVADISEADQEATRNVLDQIRRNAESRLTV